MQDLLSAKAKVLPKLKILPIEPCHTTRIYKISSCFKYANSSLSIVSIQTGTTPQNDSISKLIPHHSNKIILAPLLKYLTQSATRLVKCFFRKILAGTSQTFHYLVAIVDFSIDRAKACTRPA